MKKKYLLVSFGFLGFTALIFQVVFAKKLMLIFGLTAPAVATVLAVYFSGLALGGFIFGKIIDRLEQSAHKIYLSFFVLVGIYGILSPWLFDILSWSIHAVNKIYPLNFSGFNFFAFIFSFVFLIFPSIFIGGAFPVINKMIIHKPEEIGQNFSLLYFIETAGGVIGALFAGFLLIPSFGNNATIISASILSVLVAAALFYAVGKKYAEQLRVSHNQDGANNTQDSNTQPIVNSIFIPVLFITGFLALALEVLYTKTLILFIGSSTYAFSIILIVFLSGIAAGSLATSWFIDRIKRQYAYFGLFLGLTGFWLFLTLRFFEKVPFWYLNILESQESFDFSAVLSTQFIVVFLVIFPATFLMGIIFPLGIKLADLSHSKLGQGIGNLYFANTLGGVLGSLAGGFILLPVFGYQKIVVALAIVYFILGGIFIAREQKLRKGIRGGLVTTFIFFAIFGIFSPSWSKGILSIGVFDNALGYLRSGKEFMFKQVESREFLFYKEGLSNVAVITGGGEKMLRVNGKSDASNILTDLETEILIGALPMVFHPDPKDVLVVGLGAGVTLGTVTRFDAAKNIDVVEINPAIVEAAEYFKEDNHDALHDPRVKIIIADGRNYLSLTNKKYDVISSEPSNVFVSGNAYLFTKEYYEQARNHLSENGVVLQWVHAYTVSPQDIASIFKTFQEIFPQTYLFDSMSAGDLFLVGTMNKKPLLKFNLVQEKLNNPKIKAELARIYITNPYELFSRLALGTDGLKEFSKNAQIHTDSRPFLEYSSPKIAYKQQIIVEFFKALKLQRREEVMDLVVGGEGKSPDQLRNQELKRHFAFRQKLVLAQVALYGGDLLSAIDGYREAAALGLRSYTFEYNLFSFVYDTVARLEQEGRTEDVQIIFERIKFLVDSPEINKFFELKL